MNGIAAPRRRRLPNRRMSETVEAEIAGQRLRVTIGFYPEGAPGEVFLNGAKPGSTMDAILADAAVAISVALQCGVRPRDLAKSISRIPEQLEGPATEPASPIGLALDLIASRDQRSA